MLTIKPRQYPTAGRPRLYQTAGYKMTVHLSDEARAVIEEISKRDGICKHAVARNALLRGLQQPVAGCSNCGANKPTTA